MLMRAPCLAWPCAAAAAITLPRLFMPLSCPQALADFMTMLAHDSSRAFYGPGHVHAAHEMGAIQVRHRGERSCRRLQRAAAVRRDTGLGRLFAGDHCGCMPAGACLPACFPRPHYSLIQTCAPQTRAHPNSSPLSAPQTLLITDSLFRTSDVKKRKQFVQLVDEVTAGGCAGGRDRGAAPSVGSHDGGALPRPSQADRRGRRPTPPGASPCPSPALLPHIHTRLYCPAPTPSAGGGTVHVFSGMHASGEQLNQLTGIAAILRFPLPDLEDAEFEADW